ncbi:PAX domain containing protein, partial [Asbolus verrucosus]
LSEDLGKKIIEAYEKGIKQKDISRIFSLHKSAVCKVIGRFKTRGNVIGIRKGRRPRKTTSTMNRRLKMITSKYPRKSAKQILQEL